jgi:hypothetical protein
MLPKNKSILTAAYKSWRDASILRSKRNRHKLYTYGKQWEDPVIDGNGNIMTEREFAIKSGKKPMTNNLIRQLVKCVVGRFRNSINESDHEKELFICTLIATYG